MHVNELIIIVYLLCAYNIVLTVNSIRVQDRFVMKHILVDKRMVHDIPFGFISEQFKIALSTPHFLEHQTGDILF